MPAAHPDKKAGIVAKTAAMLCFVIAAGLMIASLVRLGPAGVTPASSRSLVISDK